MSTERIPVKVYEDNAQASKAVARKIADCIRRRSDEGKACVLGLATGHTPILVYKELARMHREEGLSLATVITFNLDEYWPIDPSALQSYYAWMHSNFFDHVDIPEANIHIPPGDVAEDQLASVCAEYEQAIRDAGGIDIQILGIGRSGHIGFNEPGSGRNSRTRRIHLDMITRKDAASDFFGEENVPEMAITMGVGTILDARELCLLAFGEHKAPVIRRSVEEGVSNEVAASFLQEHRNATFYIDEAAAAHMTRFACPWLSPDHPCLWDDLLIREAVLWLAERVHKPILKLTDEDYAENGLGELLRQSQGAYELNLTTFKRLMKSVTGWPGGKDGPKRILILSPHPDDDVICMGGTMTRLAEQGHDVHVAYMVSGCLSVFDHDVARYADFVCGFNRIFNLTPEQSVAIEQHIDRFLLHKKPGDVDSPEVQQIKSLIRRTEAIDAAKACGICEDHLHFLELPFYNTGTVQKLSIGKADIQRVLDVYAEVKPELIFAAGDMSDPHGTHRLCLEAALEAIPEYSKQYKTEPVVWLYRGAWQEWEPSEIDMAVPMSPDELRHKRYAIFRHESQKDRAMFPGPYDSREFWQRAEDRNMTTANSYDQLGLPEYHAVEAFVRYPRQRSRHAEAQLELESS